MPFRCCAAGCKGNYPTGPKVQVFCFPRDQNLLDKWKTAITRDGLQVKSSTRVDHNPVKHEMDKYEQLNGVKDKEEYNFGECSAEVDPFKPEGTTRASILDRGIPEGSMTYKLLHNCYTPSLASFLMEYDEVPVTNKKNKKKKKKKSKLNDPDDDYKESKMLSPVENEFKMLFPDFLEKWDKESYEFENDDDFKRCGRFLDAYRKIWVDKQKYFIGPFLTAYVKRFENCSKRHSNYEKGLKATTVATKDT